MEPLSVSQVSELVRGAIRSEPGLADIAVRGEVIGYSPKKHVYFNIKDDRATLKCVIWSSRAEDMDCLPLRNGQTVIAWGSVTTYPAGSVYQLDVRRLVPEGQGELYARYLALKQRLFEEGLFAPERKRPIPAFPEKVGIVTSERGAALQDMARVFMSGPGIEVLTYDARVQGEGAAETLAAGIRALDGMVDVIVIGRGGGAMEELWAFNDEALARTISDCRTPVISAVGHEIDEVLTDHVADARASTPTAAAELVLKAMQASIAEKDSLAERAGMLALDRLRNARQDLDGLDPAMWRRVLSGRVVTAKGTVDGMRAALGHCIALRLSDSRAALSARETGLRTTWVAAMAENGLAALYQDGARVRDASGLRKGIFTGMMRNGMMTGEVKDIEVRGDT